MARLGELEDGVAVLCRDIYLLVLILIRILIRMLIPMLILFPILFKVSWNVGTLLQRRKRNRLCH